jgi:hypothetical protein
MAGVNYYNLRRWPSGEAKESKEPTPFAVWCDCNGTRRLVYLTEHFYQFSVGDPDVTWRCPACLEKDKAWSDENYEKYYPGDDDGPVDEP